MSKEAIFAIIDDELKKRKDHTFLLWDFPNDVKKRIEELYQSIDNAKPSEALEGLKHIKKYYIPQPCTVTTSNYLEIIEQSLLKAKEQERVLEIIFKKYVDLNLLDCDDEVGQYNRHFGKNWQLAEEEFDLLKRYFGK